ncbi:MAG: arginine decarboxylase, pyruvoyl-dependent [Candidatus Diapherotrites archaeon]|nr:arginine decarboxylase, pyruvoyl-dependent [Candidatus Diapherotrites archaeon]
MRYLPKYVFFVKGNGVHKERLRSFEIALRDAGIAPFNLVSVSSILPPGCKIISKEKGLKMLKPGQVVFCVLARNDTNEPHRLVASAIGVAIPAKKTQYGYLSEHHSFGQSEKEAKEYAEDLAASMLASTLGIEFDPDKAWDERKEAYRMSGQIVRSTSICQSAIGSKKGEWTTTVAAAVFV